MSVLLDGTDAVQETIASTSECHTGDVVQESDSMAMMTYCVCMKKHDDALLPTSWKPFKSSVKRSSGMISRSIARRCFYTIRCVYKD